MLLLVLVLLERFRSFTRTDTVTDMIAVTVSVATQINSSFAMRHDYSLEGGVIFEAVLQDWRKSHTTTTQEHGSAHGEGHVASLGNRKR